MKYPIVILSKERPDQLRDMVRSIEDRTDPDTYRLIICDNASTQKKMVEYLHVLSKKHKVIHNPSNNGFEGFNPGLDEIDEEFFFLTDPDIILNKQIPQHWVLRFVHAMKTVMSPKMGVALDTSCLDLKDSFQRQVVEREREYWEQAGTIDIPSFQAPCYLAPVDTTLAIYRRDTYKFWVDQKLHFYYGDGISPSKQVHQNEYNEKYYIPTIRVAGNYTCQHTGWVMRDKYQNDFEYYKENCDLELASTTKWQMSGKRLDGVESKKREMYG